MIAFESVSRSSSLRTCWALRPPRFGNFKVGVKPEKRTEVFQIIDVFRAKTVDITDESIIIETTGSSSKIDALERMLSSVGLLEMVRSGKLMMARGLEPT